MIIEIVHPQIYQFSLKKRKWLKGVFCKQESFLFIALPADWSAFEKREAR